MWQVLSQWKGFILLNNQWEQRRGQKISLRSLLAEQQALERFIWVEFNSTPSLATLLSEWYPFNFRNPLPEESALKISRVSSKVKTVSQMFFLFSFPPWSPERALKIVFSCEDAALQVLMSVCLSVVNLEFYLPKVSHSYPRFLKVICS